MMNSLGIPSVKRLILLLVSLILMYPGALWSAKLEAIYNEKQGYIIFVLCDGKFVLAFSNDKDHNDKLRTSDDPNSSTSRFLECLRPSIFRGRFTPDNDTLVFKHRQYSAMYRQLAAKEQRDSYIEKKISQQLDIKWVDRDSLPAALHDTLMEIPIDSSRSQREWLTMRKHVEDFEEVRRLTVPALPLDLEQGKATARIPLHPGAAQWINADPVYDDLVDAVECSVSDDSLMVTVHASDSAKDGESSAVSLTLFDREFQKFPDLGLRKELKINVQFSGEKTVAVPVNYMREYAPFAGGLLALVIIGWFLRKRRRGQTVSLGKPGEGRATEPLEQTTDVTEIVQSLLSELRPDIKQDFIEVLESRMPEILIEQENRVKGLHRDLACLWNLMANRPPADEAEASWKTSKRAIQDLEQLILKINEHLRELQRPVDSDGSQEEYQSAADPYGRQLHKLAKEHENAILDLESERKQSQEINKDLAKILNKLTSRPVTEMMESPVETSREAVRDVIQLISVLKEAYGLPKWPPKTDRFLLLKQTPADYFKERFDDRNEKLESALFTTSYTREYYTQVLAHCKSLLGSLFSDGRFDKLFGMIEEHCDGLKISRVKQYFAELRSEHEGIDFSVPSRATAVVHLLERAAVNAGYLRDAIQQLDDSGLSALCDRLHQIAGSTVKPQDLYEFVTSAPSDNSDKPESEWNRVGSYLREHALTDDLGKALRLTGVISWRLKAKSKLIDARVDEDSLKTSMECDLWCQSVYSALHAVGSLGNCFYHSVYPGMPLHNEMMSYEKEPQNLTNEDLQKLSLKVHSGVSDVIKLGHSRLVNGKFNHKLTESKVVPAELIVHDAEKGERGEVQQ